MFVFPLTLLNVEHLLFERGIDILTPGEADGSDRFEHDRPPPVVLTPAQGNRQW